MESLLAYLDSSPSPYHAVGEAKKVLEARGFTPLAEGVSWRLEPGRAYYLTRNDSSLIAFHCGQAPGEGTPFRIAASHTDSPGFKVKGEKFLAKEGVLRLALEVYGGPIFATWLDRDLALAGRVVLKGSEGIETRLYANPERKVLLPNPPIHLNRTVNQGFEYNPQKHLKCIVQGDSLPEGANLHTLIAQDLGVSQGDILDGDLLLWDTQKAAYTGWDGAFYSSGRIDNLGMCHALIESIKDLQGQKAIAVAALFDNEEHGSLTPQGADSTFLENTLERICLSLGEDRGAFLERCTRSFLLSVDGAHGIHPNFSDLYDRDFSPHINAGPVIKKSANWNYTTTAVTASRIRLLCDRAGVPCQVYLNPSDKPSGKTLGPIAASRLGIPGVDIGVPLWCMHSVRETAGVKDHGNIIQVIKAHFED